MNKFQKAITSTFAKDVANGVKTAAINMVAILVLKAAYEGAVKLVEVASDAVIKNAEKAE